MAAKFRGAMAEHLAEPAWKTLLARLEAASPEFREVWARHAVVGPANGTKLFRNAEVGLLRLDHTDLWLGPSTGPRLVSYVPADEESRRGVERLTESALARDRA